jgi:hypothetical protein
MPERAVGLPAMAFVAIRAHRRGAGQKSRCLSCSVGIAFDRRLSKRMATLTISGTHRPNLWQSIGNQMSGTSRTALSPMDSDTGSGRLGQTDKTSWTRQMALRSWWL